MHIQYVSEHIASGRSGGKAKHFLSRRIVRVSQSVCSRVPGPPGHHGPDPTDAFLSSRTRLGSEDGKRPVWFDRIEDLRETSTFMQGPPRAVRPYRSSVVDGRSGGA